VLALHWSCWGAGACAELFLALDNALDSSPENVLGALRVDQLDEVCGSRISEWAMTSFESSAFAIIDVDMYITCE